MHSKSLFYLMMVVFLAVTACAPQIAVTPAAPSVSIATSASGTDSQGLPLNGVWRADLTADDFVRMGMMQSAAQSDWVVPYTLTFRDGKYVMDWRVEQGQLGRCEANYQIVGDVLHLTYINSGCGGGVDDLQWRIDDEGLHFHLVATDGTFAEVKAFYEAKPWQKFE